MGLSSVCVWKPPTHWDCHRFPRPPLGQRTFTSLFKGEIILDYHPQLLQIFSNLRNMMFAWFLSSVNILNLHLKSCLILPTTLALLDPTASSKGSSSIIKLVTTLQTGVEYLMLPVTSKVYLSLYECVFVFAHMCICPCGASHNCICFCMPEISEYTRARPRESILWPL